MKKLFLSLVMNTAIYLRYPFLLFRYVYYRKALPSIAFPNNYEEKIQWRKIFDRNPQWVIFSDKLATKDYLSEACPQLKLPRVLWVGTSIDDAPAGLLNGNVVVKANHGCGFNYFIRNGDYDRAELRRLTRLWMATTYGKSNAEWSYGQIKRKLFIEELIGSGSKDLIEIAIRAGRGRLAHASLLVHAKSPRESFIHLNRSQQRVAIACGKGVHPEELEGVPIPEGYDEAVRIALSLSRDVDYARYDFLWADEKLYGGEITVYPSSGYNSSRNDELRQAANDTWDIRTAWFMTAPLAGLRGYRRMLLRHLASKPSTTAMASPSHPPSPALHGVALPDELSSG